MPRPKITPFLWFDNNAEEAAKFYCSIFKDSHITQVTPGPGGAPMVVEFELAGIPFIALNGGPHFKFTEAFSLSVDCADQAEVDELGRSYPPAESRAIAAGSKTNTACPGRSFPRACPR